MVRIVWEMFPIPIGHDMSSVMIEICWINMMSNIGGPMLLILLRIRFSVVCWLTLKEDFFVFELLKELLKPTMPAFQHLTFNGRLCSAESWPKSNPNVQTRVQSKCVIFYQKYSCLISKRKVLQGLSIRIWNEEITHQKWMLQITRKMCLCLFFDCQWYK